MVDWDSPTWGQNPVHKVGVPTEEMPDEMFDSLREATRLEELDACAS